MTRATALAAAQPLDLPGSEPRLTVDPIAIAPIIPRALHARLPTHRDVLLRALLHLPRIADVDGTIDIDSAAAEIARIRAQRTAELEALRSLAAPPADAPRLAQLDVGVVDPALVAPILKHFHYLGSPRGDTVDIAATYAGRLVAVCSFSPLDLPAIAERLPLDEPGQAAVVSRVFAFDWAPRNAVSYMLARAEQQYARRTGARMLVTYINPNMGFSGASFRAANWLPLGRETGTRYSYLDGRYITDRELRRLPVPERACAEYSRMTLRPLDLLCRFLDRRLLRSYPNGLDILVERPG